jgi:hypothetical protein
VDSSKRVFVGLEFRAFFIEDECSTINHRLSRPLQHLFLWRFAL